MCFLLISACNKYMHITNIRYNEGILMSNVTSFYSYICYSNYSYITKLVASAICFALLCTLLTLLNSLFYANKYSSRWISYTKGVAKFSKLSGNWKNQIWMRKKKFRWIWVGNERYCSLPCRWYSHISGAMSAMFSHPLCCAIQASNLSYALLRIHS